MRRAVYGLLAWTLLGACGVIQPACSVSRPAGDHKKDLVERTEPVFDNRFESLSYEDLDLSRLWTEKRPEGRLERIPIHHHTVADLTERAKGAVVNLYALRLEERDLEFGLSPDKLLPMRIPLVSDVLEVPLLVLGSAERGWFGAEAVPLERKDALRLGMPPSLEIRLTVFRKGEEVPIRGRLARPPRSSGR